MKSTPSAANSDYLFHELFDRYVRRVADKCDILEITDKPGLLNNVDLSTLAPPDRSGFEAWLGKSFYIRISIENALRRGMSVRALSTQNTQLRRIEYSVRIEG